MSLTRPIAAALCCALGGAAYFWSASHPLAGINLFVLIVGCASYAFAVVSRERFPAAMMALTWFLAALFAALFAASAAYAAMNIWHIDFQECQNLVVDGAQVVKIWLFGKGVNIYQPNDRFQYLASIYPPGYYLVASSINAVLKNPYISALIVNSASLLIVCVVIYAWVRRESHSVPAAIIAVAGYIANPEMSQCVKQVRPDLLAWAVALTGTYLFADQREESGRGRMLPGVLLGLSVFIKQQVFVLLAACISSGVLPGIPWRKCLRLAVVAAVVGGVVFVALQYLSAGGFFVHSVLYPLRMAKDTGISNWANASPRLVAFAVRNAGILILVLVAMAHDAVRRKFHPLNWLILVHAPLLARMLMHWGAATNYFWGILPLMYARIGCFLGGIGRDRRLGMPLTASLFVLMFAAAPPFSSLVDQYGTPKEQNQTVGLLAEAIHNDRYRNILINSEAGSSIIKQCTGDVKCTFYDGFDLHFFERAGLWKPVQSQLFKDVRERTYDAVVVGTSFVSNSFYWNLYDAYRVAVKAGDALVCTPLDGRIIDYRVPTDQPVSRGGLSLRVVDVKGVYANASYNAFSFTKHEASPEGVVVFRIDSDRVMRSVRMALVSLIRHPGPGNVMTIEWSANGSTYSGEFSYEGSPDEAKKDFLRARSELTMQPDSPVVYVRVRLRGSAQLWFSPEYPVSFLIR